MEVTVDIKAYWNRLWKAVPQLCCDASFEEELEEARVTEHGGGVRKDSANQSGV